jgi:hypothetical protein
MAFALAIVFPIILNIYKQSLVNKLESYMRVSIRDFDDIPENPVTIFWNELQRKVKNKEFQFEFYILFSILVVD